MYNNAKLDLLSRREGRYLASEEVMEEKRRRGLRPGLISFGRSRAECTIRTISDFGAALDVSDPCRIPDEFALTVLPDGDQRRCSIVWRKENRLAVAFY